MFYCKYCYSEKKNRNSLVQHEIRCSKNVNRLDLSYTRSLERQSKINKTRTIITQKAATNKMLETKYGNIIEKTRKCPKCGKIWKYKEREKLDNEKKYCSRSCSNSKVMTVEIKQKIREKAILNGSKPIRSRENYISKKVEKKCIICSKVFLDYIGLEKVTCSKECSLKVKKGGYRQGSGIGKKGWYKGYWCDSSWELAYVIYNLEHNILFYRNKNKFEYTYEGKTYFYFPDFILENGDYVEIKGFSSKVWEEKKKVFPHKLITLYESEIEKYIDYVTTKYGKNYIRLYE